MSSSGSTQSDTNMATRAPLSSTSAATVSASALDRATRRSYSRE